VSMTGYDGYKGFATVVAFGMAAMALTLLLTTRRVGETAD
jgi:hypothetical protein